MGPPEPQRPGRQESKFQPYNEETRWALSEIRAWIGEIKANQPPRWLSLLGRSGTGKTMLSRKASKEVGGRFRQWSKIMDALREGHWHAKEMLISYPILVVDDLAAAHETDLSRATMDVLAARRLGKWTIWTSNLSLEQVGDVSHRVRSRMLREGNRVVEILNTECWATRQTREA